MLVPFTTEDSVSVAQVGGKAASLIRLKGIGALVPTGVVLTTDFFAAWLDRIETCNEWQAAIAILAETGLGHPDLATRTRLAEACDAVKSVALQFDFTTEQHSVLKSLDELGMGPFAVRSSSPEEDLSGVSFAGQYETVLNVDTAEIEEAIRSCFASCLDSRVLLYKQEMKFERLAPAIAVVVQQQVPSESSGVVFSLNPLTNDYDEILINASWGLGEALVSGDITPDSVVVSKVTGDIVEHRIGDKGADRAEEACLDQAQIGELSTEVKRIEELFGTPVDVEWAFSGGRLHVLQARPITAYVPMAPELLTEPGAPRRLYLDGYLTDGITMSGPVSPMGSELVVHLVQYMLAWAVGPVEKLRLDDYGFRIAGGRMYVDLSAYLHVMGKGKALAKSAESMDPTVAAILTSPELEQYRPPVVPKHMRRLALFLPLPKILWRMRRAVQVVVRASRKPQIFQAEYSQILADFEEHVRRPIDFDQSLVQAIREDMMHAGTVTMDSSYPAFMVFWIATFRIKALIDDTSEEQVALVDALLSGYEDDMVVNMGHALFDMAQLLPTDAFDDLQQLVSALQARSLPDKFLARWDTFVFDYGHRGPLEMDLLNPRYGDSPRLILRQIATLARSGGTFNPHDMQAQQVKGREVAYQKLLELLPARKGKKLKKLYTDIQSYNGAREYFKHHITELYHRYRKHTMRRADQFVADGRLDRADDVFQLSFEDVDRAHADASMDIRALVAEKGSLFVKQCAQVRHFPLAIDSRGRLFRPQVPSTDEPEGTLVGTAVSAGVATGPIKVLNDPFEKDVEPGDILVAVTTDPGWTPLFINAAAVILEIGGELQHGALVAREYGKPCVSGITDVTHQFEDGQIVEVDGNTGRVRLVD
ncbi:MAG TPA: PEP/pyruvate-binding domain-containing protein [Arenicellales bacterium]|jgi:pyruvate,water dikinase|nr:hypothetical protein [Gammaproteobacteria bacterium]MDP6024534.1 PEP/pyruvate-binding domain-containing protein [Pseudomonadales bacterium]MDP7313288.1 PEP/pyruvate-binding domain-containing protein [Pseudomonadales bacterium]MDP7452796.1 PEP/pyruvate-binding domain-containing protein [Arenicellales bacterium]HJL53341.1 PEP/pyruvate-binding domain-containing protein [Arenicellales bacterium]|tara:strand:+ start:194 stop:2824 length:2631 start_codon:yes stop_codon:yes gene_type:complete